MRWAVALILLVSACARTATSTRAPSEAPTLERLYLGERYDELVLLANGVIAAEHEPRERVAEARFFRALAWSAQGEDARVGHELRELELDYPDLIWGRLAGFHGLQIARVDALEATLLELLLERHALRGRIDALERQLAELELQLGRRESELSASERERGELVEQLDEARARIAAAEARLRDLEDELAALKQIDMQREP